MEVRMRHAVIVLMCLASTGVASAQNVLDPPGLTKTVNLSGPRFGMTALSPGVVAELQKRKIDVDANISQFGWQFERQFYSRDSGVAAVNEWVVLLGGLDQGVVLPSLSWLVGLRTREGAEFGIGPNVTPAGVALAVAAGVTFRAGNLNVPMNVAVVPSKVGTRISVLTGFNMRRRR
jgi:hypothetical protein